MAEEPAGGSRPAPPTDAVAELRSALGADPPQALVAALRPEHVAELAAEVRAAKRRQAAALKRAGEEALRHLPRLVRVAVMRVAR